VPDPTYMELWAIFGALFGVVFVAVLLYQHFTRPRYEPLPAPTDYTVGGMNGGRTGYLRYSEDAGSHEFIWELGGSGDLVVYVAVPTPEQWTTELPWASGRRGEILDRIAREIHRQQCRGCTWEITDSTILMLQRR